MIILDDKTKMMMSTKQLNKIDTKNRRSPELGDCIRTLKTISSDGTVVLRNFPTERIVSFHMNGKNMFTESITTGSIGCREIESDQWGYQL